MNESVSDLQKESERLGGWIALSVSEKGKHAKFLKGELHRRLQEIKDSYVRIDTRNPTKEAVVQQLVMVHTEQRIIQELIDDLSDLQIRKNKLDKVISDLIRETPSEEILNPLVRQPE